jgi:hypothetical protein
MNPDRNDNPIEYKITCFYRNCENAATQCVRIALINREGDFCEACAKDLTMEGLVVYKTTISLGIGEGKFVKVPAEEKKPIAKKEK